jgi:hypothetical protein
VSGGLKTAEALVPGCHDRQNSSDPARRRRQCDTQPNIVHHPSFTWNHISPNHSVVSGLTIILEWFPPYDFFACSISRPFPGLRRQCSSIMNAVDASDHFDKPSQGEFYHWFRCCPLPVCVFVSMVNPTNRRTQPILFFSPQSCIYHHHRKALFP